MVKAEVSHASIVVQYCALPRALHIFFNLTRRPIYLVCKTSRKVTVRLYLAITMEYT